MESKDILSKAAHSTGMTIPDGYFEDFQKHLMANLPETDFEKGTPTIAPRSIWQRVRPYAYMAAMFAGVWCMMKMFDIMKPVGDFSLEQHPVVTAAINNDEFYNNFIVPTIDESELYDDLYNEGFDTTQFEN